jgi:hypothetical protein
MIINGRRSKIYGTVGEQLHVQFMTLYNRDESVAVRFVDKLTWAKKDALRIYWKKIENDKFLGMFFN